MLSDPVRLSIRLRTSVGWRHKWKRCEKDTINRVSNLNQVNLRLESQPRRRNCSVRYKYRMFRGSYILKQNTRKQVLKETDFDWVFVQKK